MLQLSEITHKSTLYAIIKYKIDIETLSDIIELKRIIYKKSKAFYRSPNYIKKGAVIYPDSEKKTKARNYYLVKKNKKTCVEILKMLNTELP